MGIKAEMGHWSSVVGLSVHLIGDDGRFMGQVAIMCQDDTLRTKEAQTDLCSKICAAINAPQPAPSDDLRAAWIAGRDAAAEVALSEFLPLDIGGDLVCDPSQSEATAQAIRRLAPPYTPAQDAQPSVAEAAAVIVAAWDADTLPVLDPDPMMPAFIAALRALKGASHE